MSIEDGGEVAPIAKTGGQKEVVKTRKDYLEIASILVGRVAAGIKFGNDAGLKPQDFMNLTGTSDPAEAYQVLFEARDHLKAVLEAEDVVASSGSPLSNSATELPEVI